MSYWLYRTAVVALCLTITSVADAESYLMRMADVHEDRVVFTYEGDLWLVASAGGTPAG